VKSWAFRLTTSGRGDVPSERPAPRGHYYARRLQGSRPATSADHTRSNSQVQKEERMPRIEAVSVCIARVPLIAAEAFATRLMALAEARRSTGTLGPSFVGATGDHLFPNR
jgi:hypothetical protein